MDRKLYYSLKEGKEPTRGTVHSAGIDMYYNGKETKTLKHMDIVELETGLSVLIPENHFGLVAIRSGYGWKGLNLINGVGIIDSDYRGEIGVKVIHFGKEEITINPGERIAQIIIVPYKHMEMNRLEQLPDSIRGTGGFGSTGTY